MPIGSSLFGSSSHDRKKREVSVENFDTDGTSPSHNGLVVLTTPLISSHPYFVPFTNDEFGESLNQAVTFSGTPDEIHDGIDETLWTASAITGTKYTFNDSAHAWQGRSDILTFGNLSGATVTMNTSTVVEGVDWTAATSNAATATSLASALNGLADVTASASGAVVTLVSTSIDITTFSTNAAGGDQTCTAQSVKVDNSAVDDVAQFSKGSDVTMADYSAVTFHIYVDKDWAAGDSISLFGWDSDLNVQVGDAVLLEDYFTFSNFDVWQSVVILLTDFDIASVTTVDSFRLKTISKQGKSPKFYMDKIQLEAAGGADPATFEVFIDNSAKFHIAEVDIIIADALDSTEAAGMPVLSYDAILGVSELANGLVFKWDRDGETFLQGTMKNLGDMLAIGGGVLDTAWSDGTSTFLKIRWVFYTPLVLRGQHGDHLTIQLNDDMSGLTKFTASAVGYLERQH